MMRAVAIPVLAVLAIVKATVAIPTPAAAGAAAVKAVAMPAADKVSTKKVSKSGGITCCVQQCSNNSKKRKNLSFYVIPKDEKLKQLWLNKLSRKNFKPANIFKLKRKRT